jgi:hypothetical protein
VGDVKPEEAGAAIAAQTANLKEIPQKAQQLLEAEARTAASTVRVQAARAGDSLDVRVVPKGDGIRITLQGPRAAAYRAVIEHQLERRIPALKAEIRIRTTTRRSQ